MSRLSIRWRLTLWYGAVLAGVLAVFGTQRVPLHEPRAAEPDQPRPVEPDVVIEDELARTKPRSAAAAGSRPHYSRHPAFDIQVTGADGRSSMRSERILDRGLPPPSRPSTEGGDVFENFTNAAITAGSGCSAGRSPRADVPLLVQVATSLAENDSQLGELLAILLLAGPLAVGMHAGGRVSAGPQGARPGRPDGRHGRGDHRHPARPAAATPPTPTTSWDAWHGRSTA